jgi:cell division initiation protein
LRISPLDVRSQEFRKSMRGYDPEEVKAFLDAIADTMEELLKEKEAAESELVAVKKKVETFQEMEISLRDAMVAAQKAGDEAKMNARRNAELMIREADLEVRQRIADAKRKVDDVFKARETVRAEMRAFLPRLRSLLESQLTYLENIEQEVTSMDLGDGNTAEAREVRSFTQTVEARVTRAESRAREETIRQQEHAVERRQQADPLDEAMQEHHERRGQHQPAGQPVHGGQGRGGQPQGEQGQGGQPHGQQVHEESASAVPGAQGGQPHGQQAQGGQPQGEQAHRAQHHDNQPHAESAHAGPASGEHGPGAGHQPTEQEAPRPAVTGVSPWAPDPATVGPESDGELRVSHAPQQQSESQER